MSIQIASQSRASLLDEPACQCNSSAAATSAQAEQFEALLNDSSNVPPAVELTALQMLFRTPPTSEPTKTSGTTGEPAAAVPAVDSLIEDDSDGPTPAAPWPSMKMKVLTQPELGGTTKQAIRSALTLAGIDPSGVRMAYWEELVGYPGGSYINHNITIETSNGNKIDLDAPYMTRCPWLAAEAIQKLNLGQSV